MLYCRVIIYLLSGGCADLYKSGIFFTDIGKNKNETIFFLKRGEMMSKNKSSRNMSDPLERNTPDTESRQKNQKKGNSNKNDR